MIDFVSIIIPVYNDWDRLAICLDALTKQNYQQNKFEVIIVNNDPQSKPNSDFSMPPNCILINESKPGSYAARNTAIKIAKGKLLGFTDSDCIPEVDWISNAVSYFNSNPHIGRIGGQIDLFFKSAKLVKVELYEKIYAFNQDLYVKYDATAVTANMFTYAESFVKAGLFDENLLSGGDYEWSLRAQKNGVIIEYVHNVIVKHPARYHLKELKTKAKRVGGGQAKFLATRHTNLFNNVIQLVYDLRPPVRSIQLINAKGHSFHIRQKITIFSIRYYLSILTAFEKFQVKAGKKPYRI